MAAKGCLPISMPRSWTLRQASMALAICVLSGRGERWGKMVVSMVDAMGRYDNE